MSIRIGGIMQQIVVLPCTIKFTYNPAEKETLSGPAVAEELYVDSVKIAGIDLSEFLTDGMEDGLYEILKGMYDDRRQFTR